MKRIHPLTTVSLLLDITGTALFFLAEPKFIASFIFLAAYLVALPEIAKFTSVYQFVVVMFSGLLLGLSFFYPSGSPLLLAAIALLPLVMITRLIFFTTFGYTRLRYFEMLITILSLALFVSSNLLNKSGWPEWAIPAPIYYFSFYISYGVIADSRGLLLRTRKGYGVEVGNEAPGFELPDNEGGLVKLYDFRGKRDLLLIFVRGDWCPGCHMMLRTYQRESHRFQEKNILVMAIGPDPVGVNREMVKKLGLDYKVLSDENQAIAVRYGCRLDDIDNLHPVKEAHQYEGGIPLPASFLVDKKGIVRYISRAERVGEFLNPATIFAVLEKLN